MELLLKLGPDKRWCVNFLGAGGASGTIAKAISAYDKDFSDALYGTEEKGRYVCQSRVEKMLKHEYNLVEDRITRDKHPSKQFFAFANTVATINFQKTSQGHGWFGVKFQTSSDAAPSEVFLHARLHESDALQQQMTTGQLGVNLIYGCFFFHSEPKVLLKSLYDNIESDHLEIDMIQMNGPAFEGVDNRICHFSLLSWV